MLFSTLDYIVFALYGAVIIGLGLWVSREKDGHQKDTSDYFLASKSLPWWAIGASLIASNISAEQFIGMSGSGFRVGLAIASYEWMAAITLLVIAYWFLPIYLEKGIFTMPQFLEKRYDSRVRTLLAIFWLLVYVFVNLTSVLYLGALAMEGIMGVPLWSGIAGLAAFAAVYSLYGGLKAVAWTDVVQVVVLVGGGLLTTYLALDAYGAGAGSIAGFIKLVKEVPGHFNMVLFPGELMYQDLEAGQLVTKDAYALLPGLGVLLGGMWVANLYYWGFNQYIIQRTLAAKSLKEAQKGILFAAFLKLIIPLIVVIPGIAAYVMINDPAVMSRLGDIAIQNLPSAEAADKAYPWLLQFLPIGLKGLAFAALSAAIVSSLASMLNSTSTIFTMDIYKPYFNKNASDKATVNMGRISGAVALIIACIMAPLLGGIDQAFQFIQEYTGVVSPGILAVFLLGLFWKKTTNKAAIIGVICSIPIAMYFKVAPKGWSTASVFVDVPFMNQMGYTLILTMLVICIASYIENRGVNDYKGIKLSKSLFKTSPVFNIGAYAILMILTALYAILW